MDKKKLRSIGKLETWEPPDKSFSKHTISEGTGETTTNEGSICQLIITFVEQEDISEDSLGGYKVNDMHEVTIGEGDCPLADLFDKVLLSMKEGEAAYVKAKVDAKGKKVDEVMGKNKGLKFNIILKSFERLADIEDMEGDEKLEKAQYQKNRGTELFQKGNLKYAILRYERALKCLGSKSESKQLPGDLPLQHKTLIIQCHLNLAAAFLKQDMYEGVVRHCNEALDVDEKSVKGLYRRGQAYIQLHKYPEAKEDFDALLAIEPENKAARSELNKVVDKIKKEKQMYQKMFN